MKITGHSGDRAEGVLARMRRPSSQGECEAFVGGASRRLLPAARGEGLIVSLEVV
jgi:hypothetical protein